MPIMLPHELSLAKAGRTTWPNAAAVEAGCRPTKSQGGTFTITNMGVFGSYGGLPILNQPQSGILGLGAIQKRPAVVDDEIAIRQMVLMSLGIDHRLVDGALGGQFLERVRHYLENFETWVLA